MKKKILLLLLFVVIYEIISLSLAAILSLEYFCLCLYPLFRCSFTVFFIFSPSFIRHIRLARFWNDIWPKRIYMFVCVFDHVLGWTRVKRNNIHDNQKKHAHTHTLLPNNLFIIICKHEFIAVLAASSLTVTKKNRCWQSKLLKNYFVSCFDWYFCYYYKNSFSEFDGFAFL